MPTFSPKPGRVMLVVAVATIAIFGGLVSAITLQLRARLRQEVLRREAEAIHAVALMQLGRSDGRLAEFAPEFALDDVFAAVLESSTLRGVLAVQLFDGTGARRNASAIAPDEAKDATWWPRPLRQPQARFFEQGSLDLVSPQLALKAPAAGPVPLIDVAVPLDDAGANPAAAGAVARYWVSGDTVAAEFARMDRGLIGQAAMAFAGGAVLVGVVLAWSFNRLAAANRKLLEQSADLARANEELDFAAKTGALGAISAHLIHGLKNPLAGIEGFVFETVIGDPEGMRGDACKLAIETTRRLRTMVSEVTGVLRDETEGTADYPVPAIEVVEATRTRALPAAEKFNVNITAGAASDVMVSGRVANLAGLVLANLVTNAIEASPAGTTVAVEASGNGERAEFVVRDQGPGLPSTVREQLFRPVRSAKRGGGGVGLAISLRLARHAEGNLELVRSDARGTEFRLSVPKANKAVNAS